MNKVGSDHVVDPSHCLDIVYTCRLQNKAEKWSRSKEVLSNPHELLDEFIMTNLQPLCSQVKHNKK